MDGKCEFWCWVLGLKKIYIFHSYYSLFLCTPQMWLMEPTSLSNRYSMEGESGDLISIKSVWTSELLEGAKNRDHKNIKTSCPQCSTLPTVNERSSMFTDYFFLYLNFSFDVIGRKISLYLQGFYIMKKWREKYFPCQFFLKISF